MTGSAQLITSVSGRLLIVFNGERDLHDRELRTAELGLFASSVAELPATRPNIIEVTVGGATTHVGNLLRSASGNEWNTVILPLTIAAGVTRVSVQLLSEDPANPDTGDLPASLPWIGKFLSISPPVHELRTPRSRLMTRGSPRSS